MKKKQVFYLHGGLRQTTGEQGKGTRVRQVMAVSHKPKAAAVHQALCIENIIPIPDVSRGQIMLKPLPLQRMVITNKYLLVTALMCTDELRRLHASALEDKPSLGALPTEGISGDALYGIKASPISHMQLLVNRLAPKAKCFLNPSKSKRT